MEEVGHSACVSDRIHGTDSSYTQQNWTDRQALLMLCTESGHTDDLLTSCMLPGRDRRVEFLP